MRVRGLSGSRPMRRRAVGDGRPGSSTRRVRGPHREVKHGDGAEKGDHAAKQHATKSSEGSNPLAADLETGRSADDASCAFARLGSQAFVQT